MQYTPLDENNNGGDSHSLTVANGDADESSSRSRNGAVPKHLSEPLTSDAEAAEDDPFHVFREDLYRKLEAVDEGLTRYLRIVHQTVRPSACL